MINRKISEFISSRMDESHYLHETGQKTQSGKVAEEDCGE